MEPGDALAQLIRQYVATQVPPNMVEPVTRAAALTVARLMADPAFTQQLVVVRRLIEENTWLRNNLAIAQEALRTRPQARKKAPTKRAPKPRVVKGTATPRQRQAFQAGVNDLTSPRTGRRS